MKPRETLYHTETPEDQEKPKLTLSPEQKDGVRRIALGIEEAVDERIRDLVQEDVIKTLENGHPLNRLIANDSGEVTGYVACEDFTPNEAYIKYLATTGGTGRNLFKEIPAFLAYAESKGYTKLNFHGWNERLNRVLLRYGFKRIRTDSWNSLEADFYEKTLTKPKTKEQISKERQHAFEQKYLQKLTGDYARTTATFSDELRVGKEQAITNAFQTLANRMKQEPAVKDGTIPFTDLQQAILKLKLARHFQQNETIDLNTLFDALLETPKFIQTDKGSLHRLFEVHEEKTAQKIAEIRKKRAEMTGNESLNPYEALLGSSLPQSGTSPTYYLARLLNMPHLEKESAYMNHCVGTSGSYINRIKRGDIEIFSFRIAPQINPKTQKLEGDAPLFTIEYDRRTGIIEQVKKKGDAYLAPDDPYLGEFLDMLKRLRETQDDTGKPRVIKRINPSELQNFNVDAYHILTDQGEVHFKDLDPTTNPLIIEAGEIALTPKITREDAVKLIRIFDNQDFAPEEVARNPQQINENTKVYVGHLKPGIFTKLAQYNIEHIYTSFPEGKVHFQDLDIGGQTKEQLEQEMKVKDIQVVFNAKTMMERKDFTTSKIKERLKLIRLTVKDLGFPNGATTQEIYDKAQELGLELCPSEVGPHYRLTYTDQPSNERITIGMKQITTGPDAYPKVFTVKRFATGLWLDSSWAKPMDWWEPTSQFVFCARK